MLEPNPSCTLYEKVTIAELQQEELVWKADHDNMRQGEYEWDAGNLPAYRGNDVLEDEQLEPPREVVILNVARDDNKELNKNLTAKETGGKISISIFLYILVTIFFLARIATKQSATIIPRHPSPMETAADPKCITVESPSLVSTKAQGK
jgi:hypothetical protein